MSDLYLALPSCSPPVFLVRLSTLLPPPPVFCSLAAARRTPSLVRVARLGKVVHQLFPPGLPSRTLRTTGPVFKDLLRYEGELGWQVFHPRLGISFTGRAPVSSGSSARGARSPTALPRFAPFGSLRSVSFPPRLSAESFLVSVFPNLFVFFYFFFIIFFLLLHATFP